MEKAIAETSKVQIMHLNGTNYKHWRYRIETVCRAIPKAEEILAGNLRKPVEPTTIEGGVTDDAATAKYQKDLQEYLSIDSAVLTLMTTNMTDEILDHVMRYKSAKEEEPEKPSPAPFQYAFPIPQESTIEEPSTSQCETEIERQQEQPSSSSREIELEVERHQEIAIEELEQQPSEFQGQPEMVIDEIERQSSESDCEMESANSNCEIESEEQQEIAPEEATRMDLVFFFEMPGTHGEIKKYNRWQQNLVGVLWIDIQTDSKEDFNTVITFDATLAYRNTGDPENKWSSSVNALELVNGKIKIQVVTTAGCSTTVRFVNDQLVPAYWQYKDFLEVEFVPWGRTRYDENGTMVCQFGDNDCWANRVHRCALNLLDDQDFRMHYMNCEFSSPHPAFLQHRYTCAETLGISLVALDHCVTSTGRPLDDLAQEKAQLPMQIIDMVPAITFNDVIDVDAHAQARQRLSSMICFALADDPTTGVTGCQI
ncbi:gamma interferon inducible lysosomal thiol reductase (GILT) domain-containing protein [Phthorimaea operculella]|nr:gamma interferon inducible lysosomal thiol reductase (GILT) domain-containing protein [Phthorimaea operculella]